MMAYAPLEYISSCYEAPVRHASFDDSGGKRDGAFIFAGYVAPQSYWEDFNTAWDAALRLCQLSYLHTTEFLYSIKILDGGTKTDDEVYRILEPFITVIQRKLVWGEGYGVVGITESDAWKSLSVSDRKLVNQPQIDCFESAIGLACRGLGNTLSAADPVSIQLDERKDAAMLVSHYLKMKTKPRYAAGLGAICFADDKKLRSIQAADMLAHLVLRQWRNNGVLGWPERLRQLIDSKGEIKKRVRYNDAGSLRALAIHRSNS